jgi:hypothetical protein
VREISKEDWDVIIREYRESGESCSSFCLRRNISFGAMRSRLGESSRRSKGTNPLFVEIKPTTTRELVAFGVTLSNGCVVSVPQDFSADSLVRLLKAVEVVRC